MAVRSTWRATRALLVLGASVAALSAPARAQVSELANRSILAGQMFPGDGFASEGAVQEAVGDFSVQVICPAQGEGADQFQRGARIELERAGPASRQHSVLNSMVSVALTRTWSECPITSGGSFFRDVGFIDVAGDGQTLLRARKYLSTLNIWDEVEDVVATQQKASEERARAAADAEAASQAWAEAQAQEKAAAAQREAADGASRADIAKAWHVLSIVLGWTALAGIVIVAVAKHEVLMRWYFFAFHRHPAEPLVRRALASTALLESNARALARALSQPPPGSSVLRSVRLAQAEKLFRELQSASEAKQRRLEELARRNAANAHEEAAFYGMQEAVALAAAALERAKAAQASAANLKREFYP